MALKFDCASCGKEIVVRYLKLGEVAKCWNCGQKMTVPPSATQTDQIPDYGGPAGAQPVETPEGALSTNQTEGPMDKTKIAMRVGFAGAGVFFVLNLVTKGQVPGGFLGGVLGYLIGMALAYLVLAFIPSRKKTEDSDSAPSQ